MIAERFLIPIYLPRWLYNLVRDAKRIFVPATPPLPPPRNIHGERTVEWSFLSVEMPNGPGEAVEFGCEQGYMSLLAAQKGFHVIANDLLEQSFTWHHPNVEFVAGDFRKIHLPRNHFDLAVNCSSVEHVGVAGRYGIEADQDGGDVEVMERLADVLKPGGLLLMTAPCGVDTVMAPWCRVYGEKKLPKLLRPFVVEKEEYWTKNARNQWVRASREAALSFVPVLDPTNAHGCVYALGCFVLRRAAA